MGFDLQGETTDHIWGVCDFVATTNFPDIRKRCAVHSNVGSVMVIPREQIATGEYLTRLYVQVPGEVAVDRDSGTDKKMADKKKRGAVTLDYIFEQARTVFSPYTISIKEGTAPDWWAAYQIGQRMTPEFSTRTFDGIDRIFIVGDGEYNSTHPSWRIHVLISSSVSYTQSQGWARHECFHDGFVQPCMEARPQYQRIDPTPFVRSGRPCVGDFRA